MFQVDSVASRVLQLVGLAPVRLKPMILCSVGGDNANGQNSIPSGLGSVKSVALGFSHTCAIKADDSVQCWGGDNDGQSSVPAELQ